MHSLVSAVQVMKDHKADFLMEMSAKDIAATLKVHDLIPEGVEYDIAHSRSKQDANEYLLKFLMEQASDNQVQETFRIASEKIEYGRMSQFATKILQQLQQGPFVVCRCVLIQDMQICVVMQVPMLGLSTSLLSLLQLTDRGATGATSLHTTNGQVTNSVTITYPDGKGITVIITEVINNHRSDLYS